MKQITIFLSVCLLLGSCNKFLDVHPEGEFPEDQLFKDSRGYESAFYGVYASLNKTALYGSQLTQNSLDVLAQYFECFGNDHHIALTKYDYKFTSVESMIYEVWKQQYAAISNLNNILAHLEKTDVSKLKYYNLYKGEALGLRAFLHFDLLRLFTENIQRNAQAAGIPYSTAFSLQAPKAATAAEVYQLIIADLLAAEKLMTADVQNLQLPRLKPAEDFLKDREIHFNLYAVQGTLARVYLNMGKKDEAAAYAEKVIGANKFKLMDKAELGNGKMKGMLFPNETLFGLYSPDHFTTSKARFYDETTFFSYDPRKNIKTKYDVTDGGYDMRWDGYFGYKTVGTAKLRFLKLVDPYQLNNNEYLRNPDLIKGINLIRLSELYYIAAEALLEKDAGKARSYFDVVLKARGLMPLAEKQPQQTLTLDMITADRYKEFIGEGQTFFNMKRLHLPVTDINGVTIQPSNGIYNWPIPIQETEYRNN